MKIRISELRALIREELQEVSAGGGMSRGKQDPMQTIKQSLMNIMTAASMLSGVDTESIRKRVSDIENAVKQADKPGERTKMARSGSPGDTWAKIGSKYASDPG